MILLLAWGSLFLMSQELGPGPWHCLLWFGAVPSALIGVTGFVRPVVAYWAAVIYGAIIALGVIALLLTTPNAMWVIVFFPLFGFILEAAWLGFRWRRISPRRCPWDDVRDSGSKSPWS